MPTKQKITGGTVHQVPDDIRKLLSSDESLLERWEDLTPLARNEWICWVITNKKPETRQKHLARVGTDLLAGKRRPCCWIGCMHRQKLVLNQLQAKPQPVLQVFWPSVQFAGICSILSARRW